MELHWDETQEEKRARVDKILKLNSEKPLVCVSCQEIITDKHTLISTPFGPYHGTPFTCEEGRSDRDIPWYQK
jgi:adenylate kinase